MRPTRAGGHLTRQLLGMTARLTTIELVFASERYSSPLKGHITVRTHWTSLAKFNHSMEGNGNTP